MKILLVHNRYKQPGGENVVFETEGELLESHGHDVGRLVFDNACIKTFMDKVLSGFSIIYNPASARKLRRAIEQYNPDIIHVHNFVPLVSPSVFYVARRHGVPVLHTLHNYRLICPSATLVYKGKLYERSIHSILPLDAIVKGVYRNSWLQTAAVAFTVALHNLIGTWKRKVDVYIALSHFAKEKFKTSAVAIPDDCVMVKPNFVPDFGKGDSKRNDEILFVGRLVEEKGIETLLKAAQMLPFNLVIIGDGPLRDLVKDATINNSNIHYLGFQDKANIIHHMKQCRAVIVPSIWYEGCPLTILEAFSTGTVVIASKLGAMAEIIVDRFNGLLFEAGNEVALKEAIMEVAAKPEWANQLAENARASYLADYTPERNYSLLIGIYKKALARKRQDQPSLIGPSIAGLRIAKQPNHWT